MKRKNIQKHVKVIGHTKTGKPILGGAFFFMDTIGLPLGAQIIQAEESQAVVSIPRFVDDAVRAGWSREQAIRTVHEELRMIGRMRDAALVVEQLEKKSLV